MQTYIEAATAAGEYNDILSFRFGVMDYCMPQLVGEAGCYSSNGITVDKVSPRSEGQ